MFMMTEHFLSDVIEEYGEHPVSATDDDSGGTCIHHKHTVL